MKINSKDVSKLFQMLYAKVQGSEPILLDQTQLTDESSSKKSFENRIFFLHFDFVLFAVIALTDENCSEYVDEIKKRRYSKEFHSFVRSCVATKIEQRFEREKIRKEKL